MKICYNIFRFFTEWFLLLFFLWQSQYPQYQNDAGKVILVFLQKTEDFYFWFLCILILSFILCVFFQRTWLSFIQWHSNTFDTKHSIAGFFFFCNIAVFEKYFLHGIKGSMLMRKAVCHEFTENCLFLFVNRNNEELSTCKGTLKKKLRHTQLNMKIRVKICFATWMR